MKRRTHRARTLPSAEPGYLEWVDIDTLHFVGNFPHSAEVYGISSTEVRPLPLLSPKVDLPNLPNASGVPIVRQCRLDPLA